MKRYLLFVPLFLLTACKKDIYNPLTTQPSSTFSQVFDEFWNDMNVNYVYWDVDTTNWDMVYRQYKSVFSGLRLDDTADLSRSVNYFRKITDGLIDHHFSITFTSPVIRDSTITPAYDKWRNDPAFHFSWSYLSSDIKLLDSGYQIGSDNTSVPTTTVTAIAGTIHGNILLFTCNQFLLSESYQSSVYNAVKPVLDYFFKRLTNPVGLKAVVLDFRDNPGGDANDLNFLVGQFISQPLLVGYTRSKSGNGRLDYTPWIGIKVSPQPGAHTATLPIFILADKYSQSMAEIITMAFRALPQCRVIGETTFGATGPFAENALYDDGPFSVAGFFSVTTSSVEFKYVDGKMYERVGFPPDYPVGFNIQALNAGDDPQMDKALSLIPR
jgi:carboxyl-terminal processing protease